MTTPDPQTQIRSLQGEIRDLRAGLKATADVLRLLASKATFAEHFDRSTVEAGIRDLQRYTG